MLTPASADNLRAEIELMYRQHNPAKLSELNELFKQYEGDELNWLRALRKKYGAKFVDK